MRYTPVWMMFREREVLLDAPMGGVEWAPLDQCSASRFEGMFVFVRSWRSRGD